MAIITDIAKKLNVSISTVSKALNDATDVADGTKQRIIAEAENCGYRSAKRKKANNRLCIFLENYNSPHVSFFGYDIIMGFKEKAAEYSQEVILHSLATDFDNKRYDDIMHENNFAGAFVVGLNLRSSYLEQFAHTLYPTVLLDNMSNNDKVSCICVDNIQGMKSAVDYLAKSNHKRIGLLNGEEFSQVSNERFAGYWSGLGANGLAFDGELVRYGNFTEEGGRESAKIFAEKGVSAVVCSSDIMALGLIKGLQEFGLRVPQDVSVVGFDDILLSQFVSPPLTTVRQNKLELGRNAVKALNQIISGNRVEKIVLSTELIVRGSTHNRNN